MKHRTSTARPSLQKGKIIALVGCDGAGKSTLTAELVARYRESGRAVYLYLGQGTGDLGRKIGRLPLIGGWLEAYLTRKAKKTHSRKEKMPGPFTTLVVFGLSLLRYRRFARVARALKRDRLVITDRWPQAEMTGQFDGPSLAPTPQDGRFVHFLAALERKLYQKMAALRPDMLLRLEITPRTALRRKPDHDRALLTAKCAILPKLTYNKAPMVRINAEQPLETVRKQLFALTDRFLKTGRSALPPAETAVSPARRVSPRRRATARASMKIPGIASSA